MDFLKWNYYGSAHEEVTIGELRRMARSLLEGVYHAESSTDYTQSSGGFEATRYMYPVDTEKYLTLKFVVTEWSNPAC